MDKEREAFEAWFELEFDVRPTRGKEVYLSSMTEVMWRVWQARAKQTITLPVKDATGEH